MPRRHRSARDRPAAPPPRPPAGAAPAWAHAAGFDVRQVAGGKPYICPGCEGTIAPGTVHLVVVPNQEPEARRHWHAHCWRIRLRRGW